MRKAYATPELGRGWSEDTSANAARTSAYATSAAGEVRIGGLESVDWFDTDGTFRGG